MTTIMESHVADNGYFSTCGLFFQSRAVAGICACSAHFSSGAYLSGGVLAGMFEELRRSAAEGRGSLLPEGTGGGEACCRKAGMA